MVGGTFGTVLALIAAAIVAAVIASLDTSTVSTVERFRDAGAIGLIVLINAVIGFLQERKAERAVAALQSLTVPHAWVVREGKACKLAAKVLVPGDLVR